jgi:hypothetical protein
MNTTFYETQKYETSNYETEIKPPKNSSIQKENVNKWSGEKQLGKLV